MSYAYDRVYLDKARIALGRMLDFAVYNLKYEISEFFDLFVSCLLLHIFQRLQPIHSLPDKYL